MSRSQYSDNPFATNDLSTSPFSDPAVTGYTTEQGAPSSSAWGANASGGAWGTSNGHAFDSVPATIAVDRETGNIESIKRTETLDAKEKALQAKEAELRRWEADLRATGGLKPKKNWPWLCPIVHHDIFAEVPAPLQSAVQKGYYSYLGMMLCMLFNFFGSLMALCIIGNADGRLSGWFLAIIYLVAGIPIGWWAWYRRLYNAAIKDRALTYAWFFIFYLIHIAFCVWSAISPPLPGANDWSHTGFIACLKAFKASKFVGVLYAIGGALWTIESLWSLWVMKTVYTSFRGGGGEAQLRREVAQSVATNAAAHALSSRV